MAAPGVSGGPGTSADSDEPLLPRIVLTAANLNALRHGYLVVTNDAVIVLDKQARDNMASFFVVDGEQPLRQPEPRFEDLP